ncbi:hypothetical protein RB195_019889 [Necator americanus]|uniref:Activin types I and II receptor domain protein n=1 Tax=Necator americanus TaxID=51031 RepID=A0ABR1CJT4_NECAM
MIRLFFTRILLLTVIPTVYSKLNCTKCPFYIEPKGHTNCTETCEGDVCYIVVNQFYNGTKIAGCLDLYEGDTFKEGPAICYREEYQTSCACNTSDFCNSPTSPIANFNFTESPILQGYQLQPLVGGGRNPPEGVPDLGILTPSPEIESQGVKPGETTTKAKTETTARPKSAPFTFSPVVVIVAVSLTFSVIF